MKYGETHKTWHIELDGQAYAFRLEYQFWTGEKKYFIDNKLVEHVPGGFLKSASFASNVPFTIGNHNGKFQHRAIGRAVFFDLIVDNEKIEGEEKSALRLPLWMIALLMIILIFIALSAMKFG